MQALHAEAPNKTTLRTDYPIPTPRPKGVRVKVQVAQVGSNLRGVLAGEYLGPLLPFPYIPGGGSVGIVDEIGPEVVSDLQKGELVLCVPAYGKMPNAILVGVCHFGTELSRKLSAQWRDGSYAEYAVYPVENVIPVRGELGKKVPVELLAKLNTLAISYGGIKTGGVRAGQVVVVAGATGSLGMGCVMLSLALGASKVYALGRNKEVLKYLTEYDNRVVALPNEQGQSTEDYLKHVKATIQTSADVYIDALGNLKAADWTEAGISTVKPKGTAVLMGGVEANVAIPYRALLLSQATIKGSYMFDTETAIPELLQLVESQVLKLDWVDVKTFPIQEWKEAARFAAEDKDGRIMCAFSL